MLIQKTDSKNSEGLSNDLDAVLKDSPSTISYLKTNKLITALYMVTDIIDKDEPLRNKLRTLGADIISDMHSNPSDAYSKISQIMSFLDIASTMNIISEMNTKILRKEFSELNQSIKESTGKVESNGPINLSEFFIEQVVSPKPLLLRTKHNSLGHQRSSRIGIQKGSTLMKALHGIEMSDKNSATGRVNFDLLRQERRTKIINIIKGHGGVATIKDIKNKINDGVPDSLICGEKTLQRELLSMIKDNVLEKMGEKRWSRYFIKNQVS